MGGMRWTAEEDDELEQLFGEIPVEKIATKMGRSLPSIRVRVTKLGLGKRLPHDALTMNETMTVVGCQSHVTLRRWIRDGYLTARRQPRYGRADRPVWAIQQEDVIAFLREYPHLVDRDKVQPPFQQYVSKWITLPSAFVRGAAHPFFLESAAKAGLLPEARRRGDLGTWWVVPESTLPALVAARRTVMTDEAHRRLVLEYRQAQHSLRLQRSAAYLVKRARAGTIGGHSGRAAVVPYISRGIPDPY